jgi:hypothetical protein
LVLLEDVAAPGILDTLALGVRDAATALGVVDAIEDAAGAAAAIEPPHFPDLNNILNPMVKSNQHNHQVKLKLNSTQFKLNSTQFNTMNT